MKNLELKMFNIVGIPENGLIQAYGKAEAKQKAFNFYQSCYGNDYNILDIVDVTNRNIKDRYYLNHRIL